MEPEGKVHRLSAVDCRPRESLIVMVTCEPMPRAAQAEEEEEDDDGAWLINKSATVSPADSIEAETSLILLAGEALHAIEPDPTKTTCTLRTRQAPSSQ